MTRILGSFLVAGIFLLCSGTAWAGDLDGDGVSDGTDNCGLAANPDQQDSDDDGAGNACDFDYNNDGQINDADAALIQAAFGSDGDSANSNVFDADSDGLIAGTDWNAFVQARSSQ